MNRIDWASFFSNILAVVLGIFITFGIQELIDRKEAKENVRSALELVREELANNRTNLQEVTDILASEKEAAEYFRANLNNILTDDADSLLARHTVLCSEYFITITDDALELLKSSSLFQKMNDNTLALNIIQAYDYLEASSQTFNAHEKYKIDLCEEANTIPMKQAALNSSSQVFLRKFYSSGEGGYLLQATIEMSHIPSIGECLAKIDSTISVINRRLAE